MSTLAETIHELPSYTPLPATDEIILNQDFKFKFFLKGKIRTLFLPASFRSDGGSIPRMLWAATMNPFAPKGIVGFLFHDYGYKYAGLITSSGQGIRVFLPMKRRELDYLLREMHKYYDVGRHVRNKIYYGLKPTGWVAWNKYRNRRGEK